MRWKLCLRIETGYIAPGFHFLSTWGNGDSAETVGAECVASGNGFSASADHHPAEPLLRESQVGVGSHWN